jgi:hypothetical protein
MKVSCQVLLLFLVSLIAISAPAQGRCAIGAWVEDPEIPKDLMVRQKPSSSSRRLGEIPMRLENGEEPLVEITGYSRGWVRIRKAETIEGQEIFKGDGWILASRVRTNVQTQTNKPAHLYGSPGSRAKRVATLPTETMVTIVGFDCFGFKVSSGKKTGWLARGNSCGNPVTTCP